MTPNNEYIVAGETKSGIKFQIDKRIKDDARTLLYIRNMRKYKDMSASPENEEKATEAVFSILELIFGSGDGLMTFMNEVAYHHDGVADVNALLLELTEIFDLIDLKN